MARWTAAWRAVAVAGLALCWAPGGGAQTSPSPDAGAPLEQRLEDALQETLDPTSPVIEVAPDDTPLAPGLEALGVAPSPEDVRAASVAGDVVVLRGLDKLSGRVETFEVAVGETTMYERLEVDVKACYARKAERAPESSAFIQIHDTQNDPPEMTFSGWMFASSPALSAMDHPRYDVWVLSCKIS